MDSGILKQDHPFYIDFEIPILWLWNFSSISVGKKTAHWTIQEHINSEIFLNAYVNNRNFSGDNGAQWEAFHGNDYTPNN